MDEAISRDTQIFRSNLGVRVGYCTDKIGKKSGAATVAGVSAEQLNKWIKGTVKVPVEALRLLAEAADVDFSWLATGEGVPPTNRPMQIRSAPGSASGGSPRFAEGIDAAPFVQLPLFDVAASAGVGLPVGSEVQLAAIAFDPDFLRERGAVPDRCSIITASGDSMQPSIPDGSLLVVDHSQIDVKNGHIMVVNVGEDLLVKRIRRRLDGLIELISDNPAYPPETISRDALQQLRVVGRVVYFCRTP